MLSCTEKNEPSEAELELMAIEEMKEVLKIDDTGLVEDARKLAYIDLNKAAAEAMSECAELYGEYTEEYYAAIDSVLKSKESDILTRYSINEADKQSILMEGFEKGWPSK